MTVKGYLIVSGVFFLVVALLHLVRLALHVSVQVGEWVAPLWMSFGGFVVPLALSIVAFRLICTNCSKEM